MKILSKYKDYYDYYQGVFGMDESKTYDRRKVVELRNILGYDAEMDAKQERIFTFAICGIEYSMRYFRGKFYHTVEELAELDELVKDASMMTGWRRSSYGIDTVGWNSNNTDFKKEFNKRNGIPTDVNHKMREPILMNYQRKQSEPDYVVPLLSSFDFHKIMDAKTIYIEIETFLGWLVDNPPLPDDQTNVGKIEGHGFDKKYSFRPQMK